LLLAHSFFDEVCFYERDIFFEDLGLSRLVGADDAPDDARLVVAPAVGDGGGDRANLQRAGE